jgi:multidrug efflux pump subunit AcrA (membrane-fusion protein)
VEQKRAAALAERGFYGTITPRKATPLHAPPNVFRFKGWNSRSTWIKVIEVVADGARVTAGQEVARFEFSYEDALPWIKKRITETSADAESTKNRGQEEARQLDSAAAVKGLDRQKAELDTDKAGLVSDRDLALLKLAAQRAHAEEDAAVSQARAARSRSAAELYVYDARADDWKNGVQRYQAYERRTHILAPHAGLVRWGYLNHARRKLQKPDDMPSGTPFVFVAEDERLSVEFLVPEHRVREIAVGKKVTARLPDDERRAVAVVREILAFPQEVGFLRGDDELPDAREKAYAVIADFDQPPPYLGTGIEVRVEP